MKCLRNKKRHSPKKCQLNQTQLSRWHTTETYWACQCSALLCGFHSCCRTMLILISNWQTIRFHLLLTWNRCWAVGDEYRVTEGRTILRTNEAVLRALACASWQCARPNDKSFHSKDWTNAWNFQQAWIIIYHSTDSPLLRLLWLASRTLNKVEALWFTSRLIQQLFKQFAGWAVIFFMAFLDT